MSPEVIRALDDLVQAAATASSSLRAMLVGDPNVSEAPRSSEWLAAHQAAVGLIDSAQQMLSSVDVQAATDATVATVRAAVAKLVQAANTIGDSATAQSLTARLQALPGTNWLTILGLAAGALAIYMLWQNYGKTKKLGEIIRSEPEDIRPRLRSMGKSLGSLGRLSKYRFEPESRLEGHRLGKYRFEPESKFEGHRSRRAR